jgi:hypothetical protein
MAAGMVAAEDAMVCVMLFSSGVYERLAMVRQRAKPRMADVRVALSLMPVLSPT